MNEMKKVLILLALCLLITLCACKENSDKKTPQAWCVNAVIEDIGNLDNYILWVSESGNQTPESESNCVMYIIEIYDNNTDFYYKYATSISFKQTPRGAIAKAISYVNGIDKDTTSVNKITESDILDLDVELIYTNKINE